MIKYIGGKIMIIKLGGILLVMISTTLLGFGFAECMSSRERELKNLADAIGCMINELEYSLEPVKILFKKVMLNAKGFSYELFEEIEKYINDGKTVSEAWEFAIRKKATVMCLNKNDCETLVNCSDAFCAYELEQQKALLKGLQSRIFVLADDAGEFKRKNAKLVKMLGVYGGVFICAVLF